MPPKPQDLDDLLAASQATEEFKQAVRDLEAGKAGDRIKYNAECPPVKVLRVLMKLFETHPDWPVERAIVHARSGCSDFVGQLVVEPGDKSIDFVWDCRWRAEQEGIRDPLGDADQIRAARTFGYQCFKKFGDA